jgi:predicted YcjX-like family ATPase
VLQVVPFVPLLSQERSKAVEVETVTSMPCCLLFVVQRLRYRAAFVHTYRGQKDWNAATSGATYTRVALTTQRSDDSLFGGL